MIEGFWQEVNKVWDAGIFGTNLGDIFLAVGIFLIFLLARKLFSQTTFKSLKLLVRKTKTDLDDQILAAIKQPLEFAFVVIGLYVASQFVPLSDTLAHILAQLVRSMIAITIFWAIFRIIDPLSSLFDHAIGLFGSESMHETIKGFFVKVTKAIVVALGIAAVFQEWGFNVAAVLGSLGLIGMAVALGAQDFIKNMFAGLTIFLDRVFEKGNWIKTPDVEGTVEEIGFRATKVRQFDKALVTLPNSKLANEALINYSRMTNRRIHWMIGIEYRSTKEQILNIVQAISSYIHECGDFETDPAQTKTFIFLDSFGSSSIDIKLYCFTKTTVWGEWLEAKERLAYKIKEIVEGQNASFAFPSTSLYVETLPFGTPEPFALPKSSSPPSAPSSR